MNQNEQQRFDHLYQRYLNELTLQGKSPRTIEAYSRCIRKLSEFFDGCPDHLTVWTTGSGLCVDDGVRPALMHL